MNDDNNFVKRQLFPDSKPVSKRKNKGRHKKNRTTSHFEEHTIFETE